MQTTIASTTHGRAREPRRRQGAVRWLVLGAAVSTGSVTTSALVGAGAAAAAGERIVFVAGSKPVAASDAPLLVRLQANTEGLPVDVVDDAKVATIDPIGVRAVVVSSTVGPAAVGTKLRDLAVPVVVAEPKLLDEMSMAATNGETPAATSIDIVAAGDPLAAGTSGRVAVLTQAKPLSFGSGLASGATVVATAPGQATKAVLFIVPGGATLLSGQPAPACRTAVFTSASAPAKLTASGVAIVDAAIAGALSCSSKPGFSLDIGVHALAGSVVPRFVARTTCSRASLQIGDDTRVLPVGGGRLAVTETAGQALQPGDVCRTAFATTAATTLPAGWAATPANPTVTVAVSPGGAPVTVAIDQIDAGPLGFTIVQDLELASGVPEPGLAMVMQCVRGTTPIGAVVLPQPTGDLMTMVVTKVIANTFAAGDVCTLRAAAAGNRDLPPGVFVGPQERTITISQAASTVEQRFTYTSGPPHGFTLKQDLPANVPAGTPPSSVTLNCRRGGAAIGGVVAALAPGDLSKTVVTTIIARTLQIGDVCDAAVTAVPAGWSVSPASTLITVTGSATAKTVTFTFSRTAQPRGFTIVQDLADGVGSAVPPFTVDVQCRRGPIALGSANVPIPAGDLALAAVTWVSAGQLVAGDECTLAPRGVGGAVPTGWLATIAPATVTVSGAAGSTTLTMSVERVVVTGLVIRQEIVAPPGTPIPSFSAIAQCRRGTVNLGGRLIPLPPGSPTEVVLDRINSTAFQIGDTCTVEPTGTGGVLPAGWTATPTRIDVVAAADATTAVAVLQFRAA